MSPQDLPRRRQNAIAEAIMTWVYIAIIVVALVLIGFTVRRALAYADDGFVRRLEFLLHLAPGAYIPVNPQAPDIRLQYLGTREVGHDTYDVRVHRVR